MTTNRESGILVTIAVIRLRMENIVVQESWTTKEEVGCFCSFPAFADTYNSSFSFGSGSILVNFWRFLEEILPDVYRDR